MNSSFAEGNLGFNVKFVTLKHTIVFCDLIGEYTTINSLTQLF